MRRRGDTLNDPPRETSVDNTFWLVVYEYRRSGNRSWTRENEVVRGCPGVWWAEKLAWYRQYEEAGLESARSYAARGEQMPLSEEVLHTYLRFLCSSPISEDGYDALDGKV